MADIEILAESTVQVAVAEKDGAGAVTAHKGGFLAEMRGMACHDRAASCFAGSGLARDAVNPAAAWTHFA